MCRSIKVLRKLDPPATHEDTHKAALQYVKKISGFQKPSRANQPAFDRAVQEIAEASDRLLATIAEASEHGRQHSAPVEAAP